LDEGVERYNAIRKNQQETLYVINRKIQAERREDKQNDNVIALNTQKRPARLIFILFAFSLINCKMQKTNSEGPGIRVQASPRRSWWHRLLIFCCEDSHAQVSRPEHSSIPDNPGFEDYRPIHGQVSQKFSA